MNYNTDVCAYLYMPLSVAIIYDFTQNMALWTSHSSSVSQSLEKLIFNVNLEVSTQFFFWSYA